MLFPVSWLQCLWMLNFLWRMLAGAFFPYSQPLAPACFLAPNTSNMFSYSPGLVTSTTVPEVCMPTHVDPTLSTLAMVACFDAQDLIDDGSMADQETTFWSPHEHLWHFGSLPSPTTCSEDGVFFGDELCVPFSTHLLPHHSQDLILSVPRPLPGSIPNFWTLQSCSKVIRGDELHNGGSKNYLE